MTDHAPLLDRLFPDEFPEQSVEIPVLGTLPAYVRGTCLMNGPARFGRAGLRYRHWLDGDGMVATLILDAHAARYTSRYVGSTKQRDETAAGAPIYRTFGTAFPGDRLKRGIGLESPVNVSAYRVGDALLAFGEQGLPWALDPQTLETRGLHTFDGQLNDVTPFSAHAKVDPHTGELFNFGVSFSATQPTLHLFCLQPDGALRYRKRVALPYPASMHDFAISEHYVVFHVAPYVLRMDALTRDGGTLIESLSWEPERGSWLLVLSRQTGEEVCRVSAGHGYCLHLVNAFEAAGQLCVDVVEYDRPLYPEYQVIPDLFSDTLRGHPVRFTLALDAPHALTRRDLAYDRCPDFPAHVAERTGRAYRSFWMLGISAAGQPGRKFFDQVVRIDWDTGEAAWCQAAAGCYWGGEPIVIPDPSAPDTRVTVLCQQFDPRAGTNAFVAFDGFALHLGPVATLPVPAPMHAGFHTSFHGAHA